MHITAKDRANMRAWLESVGLAPTQTLIDALIQLFRSLEGGEKDGKQLTTI